MSIGWKLFDLLADLKNTVLRKTRHSRDFEKKAFTCKQ